MQDQKIYLTSDSRSSNSVHRRRQALTFPLQESACSSTLCPWQVHFCWHLSTFFFAFSSLLLLCYKSLILSYVAEEISFARSVQISNHCQTSLNCEFKFTSHECKYSPEQLQCPSLNQFQVAPTDRHRTPLTATKIQMENQGKILTFKFSYEKKIKKLQIN